MRRLVMSRFRKLTNTGEKLPSLAILATRSFFLASDSTGLDSTEAMPALLSEYAEKVSTSAWIWSSVLDACALSASATA